MRCFRILTLNLIWVAPKNLTSKKIVKSVYEDHYYNEKLNTVLT